MWIRPQRVRLFLRFFLDLLFCRFDEMWSAARPDIIYIVPTRFSTVVGLHANHRSQYKKKRDLQPLEKMPHKKHKQYKRGPARKSYTIKDPRQYAKENGNNRQTHGGYCK